MNGPPVKLASFNSRCSGCGEWITKDETMIVFDFDTSQWVHDNTGCRRNDTVFL